MEYLCPLRNDIISVIADGFTESRLSVADANESKLLSFSAIISITNLYICANIIFKVKIDLAKPESQAEEFILCQDQENVSESVLNL